MIDPLQKEIKREREREMSNLRAMPMTPYFWIMTSTKKHFPTKYFLYLVEALTALVW